VFTLLIGEVDHVPGTVTDLQAHKISTRFFSFIGPLIPFESLCVTYENVEHLGGRTTRHSYSGERVPLNLWSILLGYLRVWPWIAVLVLPFALYWGKRVEGYMFVPSGYALIAAIVVAVVPGLVTKGRSRRLAVLRRVIGLGCDPAYRYAWRKEEATGVLMAQLGERQLPSSPEALSERVSSMDKAQLELVFTTAWYQGKQWNALREAAWAKLATLA
jgi:hypothetical protein